MAGGIAAGAAGGITDVCESTICSHSEETTRVGSSAGNGGLTETPASTSSWGDVNSCVGAASPADAPFTVFAA